MTAKHHVVRYLGVDWLQSHWLLILLLYDCKANGRIDFHDKEAEKLVLLFTAQISVGTLGSTLGAAQNSEELECVQMKVIRKEDSRNQNDEEEVKGQSYLDSCFLEDGTK